MPRKTRRSNPNRKPMTACERGNWIDTEGHVQHWTPTTRVHIAVAQKEREPLNDYCEGARRDGVKCKVVYRKATDSYEARVRGLKNVAKEIALTRNCIRTKRRNQQIQKLIESLKQPRYAYIPRLGKVVPATRKDVAEALNSRKATFP